MAVLYIAGAELQDLTANVEVVSTTGSVSLESTIVRSGLRSYKFAAAGSEASMQVETLPGAAGDFVRTVWIYFPTGGLPASLTKIIQLQDATGDHTSIRINSNGTLELWDDA